MCENLKVYEFGNVSALEQHEGGVCIAIAESKEEAIKNIVADYFPTSNDDNTIRCREDLKKELTTLEPMVYPAKGYSFFMYGSA